MSAEPEDQIVIAPKGAKFCLKEPSQVDPEAAAEAVAQKAKGAAKLLQSEPAAVNAGRQAGAGNAMLFHTWDPSKEEKEG